MNNEDKYKTGVDSLSRPQQRYTSSNTMQSYVRTSNYIINENG